MSRADARAAGFEVRTFSRESQWEKTSTFRKAKVLRGVESVEIDWAADSAFRFFPIEQDPQLGWRLHLFDLATLPFLWLCTAIPLVLYAEATPGAPDGSGDVCALVSAGLHHAVDDGRVAGGAHQAVLDPADTRRNQV